MSDAPVLNPELPYVGRVEGMFPGKMLKVQGSVPSDAARFAINYQLGPNLNPRDDIAVHVSPRFPEGFITRNHIESMNWGPEENDGPLPIKPGDSFEILILCEPQAYKVAINGNHFAEFVHRLPYHKVTHLVIDGDVNVKSIAYEIISVPPRSPRSIAPPDVPNVNVGPPPPGGLYPTIGATQPQPGYGPPPPGAYGGPGDFNPQKPYGYQPGYEKAEEEDAFGGCLDKVGMALGGLVAAGGVAAAMHAYNKHKENQEHGEKDHEKTDASKSESEGGFGNLGALGAALASSLAANAMQGNATRPVQGGYPGSDQSGGGMLGSILGALGGGGAGQQQGGYQQPPPPPAGDPFGGALGSILGGVLGGNSAPQQPAYQPSGGYGGGYPGGYGNQNPAGQSGGSDLLSGLGGAIGSSLLSSALDGLTKHRSHDSQPTPAPPQNYGAPDTPREPPRSRTPPSSGKLSAAEISKGLGLGDDEE